MTNGNFVWTDLSTFDVSQAREDYEAFFGWDFSNDPTYDFAFSSGSPVAAIFPMPQKLIDINMPSFWMSYVRVENLEDTLLKARAHEGVIIEIEPVAFDDHSTISLVRDPSGAGFTLYQGPDITPPPSSLPQATMRYHHVPSVELIRDFYADLFGWRFQPIRQFPWAVYDILDPSGCRVAQVETVPESIRGKFRYWMPCFTVPSLDQALETIKQRNGSVQQDLDDGRWMVADRQGAAFMIQ